MDSFEIDSAALGVSRRVSVWLPASYRTRGRTRFPVLYLNDGQNLFEPARAFAGVTWRAGDTAARLIHAGEIPPLVIVGIDHGGVRRNREYLPVEDEQNPHARHPLGREYGDFVTRELKPYVERTFRVAKGALNAGFGGSSYGAIAALYSVLARPGVFGRLLLESPSLHVGHGYLLQRARSARRWPLRVYVGVGTAETHRRDVNEQAVANVRTLERLLRKAGLGAARLRVVVEDGATHSEAAWAERLPDALRFLFGERS